MFQSYTEGSERNRTVLTNFGGLNANEYCEPQEMRDMLNLSGDAYPYLTQRAERTEERHSGNLEPPVVFRAACMHDGKLAVLYRVQAWYDNDQVLHGTDQLWYDGKCKIENVNSFVPEYFREQLKKRGHYESTLLSNGAEILIFPEGISYNTEANKTTALSAYQKCEYKNDGTYGLKIKGIKLSLCTADGEGISAVSSEPESPTNGQYWADGAILKKWSQSSGQWVEIATTYVKITLINEGVFASSATWMEIENQLGELDWDFTSFVDGDSVKMACSISNLPLCGFFKNHEYAIIQKSDIECFDMIEQTINGGTHLIMCPYIIVRGTIDARLIDACETEYKKNGCFLFVDGGYFELVREIPIMDHYTVSKNRVWGCRYDGNINEIRCSKQGDFGNWNVYAGVSTDSYAVSIGAPGEFTGIATYEGEPYFFKENCIMRIYGDYPAAYQLYTYSCAGAEKGSSKSIVADGGYLYYKSPNDFCVFNGSRPQSLSYKLGHKKYRNVVSGASDGKIYHSCVDEQGENVLLVYDPNVSAWYKEGNERYLDFCQDNTGLMYGINDTHIVTFERGRAEAGSTLEWYAEAGLLGLDTPDQKAIGKFTIRARMDLNAELSVLASYDEREFEHLYTCTGKGLLESHTFSLNPVRCDNVRLRLEGKGRCTIYSIAYTVEQRSDQP